MTINKMKTLIGTIFITILVVCVFVGNAYSNEPANLFIKAQKLYDKAIGFKSIGRNKAEMLQLFEEASAIYTSLINEHHIQNAYLYYNLANCSYNMGNLGNAIFYYRIAQQLNPSFRDINKNLAETRSLVKDYVEDKSKTSILPVLFFWHYQTQVQTRLWIGIIFFIAIWILAIVNLFVRKGILKVIVIVCVIMSIAMFASITTQLTIENTQSWGVITESEGIDAKKGPGNNYESSFVQKLSDGIEFSVIEKTGEFVKIKLKNDEVCLIPLSSTKIADHSIIFN